MTEPDPAGVAEQLAALDDRALLAVVNDALARRREAAPETELSAKADLFVSDRDAWLALPTRVRDLAQMAKDIRDARSRDATRDKLGGDRWA